MNPMILPASQIRLVTQFSRMAIEAQMVIGMRMAGMMGLITQSPGEPFRMIAEKQAAASEAMFAMASAGMRGHSTERMLSAGMRPYGRRTRANSRRLTLVK
ncbi:antibiotic ABC transporter [Paracoccus liaowanqingii]|uniref:Antibiotic ABC transporter n=1 Tax=Paracoccus liaowanqingii TaxID=2560053 RepID=A0A4P7HPK9_9RHOB|nr:CDP-diacylglycerol diphosphatase [Paracoccus liaowanqingii]TGN59400.1 antibiotic ABC transporter [Paracoccus liaowanqingii]